MKLNETIETIMTKYGPQWLDKINNGDASGISNHCSCIVGEFYGDAGCYKWKSEPEYCEECVEMSIKLYRDAVLNNHFRYDKSDTMPRYKVKHRLKDINYKEDFVKNLTAFCEHYVTAHVRPEKKEKEIEIAAQ